MKTAKQQYYLLILQERVFQRQILPSNSAFSYAAARLTVCGISSAVFYKQVYPPEEDIGVTTLFP